MELPVNYEKLDWEQRRNVREQYVNIQGGKCYYCQRPLDMPITKEQMKNRPIFKRLFPKNFFKYPVHLHHNHDTGMTIGAVHNYCNAVLWQYHKE